MTALQRDLRVTLDRLDRTLKRIATESDAAAGTWQAVHPGRPLRVVVLDLLQELGGIAYAREVAAYAFARYDVVIRRSRFGSLASDEEQAYARREGARSRNRTLWLCFALRHDDAAPVKRLLARSDWPLEERIWAPTTGRVQHLRMVVKLCDLALDAERVQLANPDALNDMIAAYARDLPVKVLPGEYAVTEWRERALGLLQEGDLERTDYELRLEAAERWSGLSEMHQLFGREPADLAAAHDAYGRSA